MATLTTQSNGLSNTVDNLQPKQYFVKEIKAPKGFYLDPNVKVVTVKAGDIAKVEFNGIPMSDPIDILVEKRDKDSNSNQPQGSRYSQLQHFLPNFLYILINSNINSKCHYFFSLFSGTTF